MKKRLPLTAVLLGVVLSFVVSGVGHGEVDQLEIPPDSEMTEQEKKETQPSVVGDLSGVYEQFLGGRGQPERSTFLVFSMNEKEEVLSMLWDFLDIYPNAEIPEEFAWVLPSGANDVTEIRKQKYVGYPLTGSKDLMLSLLLTMAYQQDYEIEHVTSSYMLLVKSVYEEELKEWEERLGGEE